MQAPEVVRQLVRVREVVEAVRIRDGEASNLVPGKDVPATSTMDRTDVETYWRAKRAREDQRTGLEVCLCTGSVSRQQPETQKKLDF